MLEVHGLVRSFDGNQVLRGIDLTAGPGEVVCILGPSGCGKTTLLRIIAGLETIDAGAILYAGHSLQGIPSHARDFGLMFQDFALFPHMDVARNVSFGLKMRGVDAAQQAARVKEMLALVGLSGFERRDVTALSGGEKQRVALARSLAPNPRLLMLDEPLGSLDAELRRRLAVELRAIIKQVGLTAIYVTHDQEEAFAIADRIAVMNAGMFEQVGSPERVYRAPQTIYVARFLGLNNILPVTDTNNGKIATPAGQFLLPPQPETIKAVLLHPDGLRLDSGPDTLGGEVTECVFAGDVYRVSMRLATGDTLSFKVPSYSGSAVVLGETIHVRVSPESVIPLAK